MKRLASNARRDLHAIARGDAGARRGAWYDADHQVRRVRGSGEIKWKDERVFVSEALVGEPVGIAELETGDHVERFCDRDIGLIDRTAGTAACAAPLWPVRRALGSRNLRVAARCCHRGGTALIARIAECLNARPPSRTTSLPLRGKSLR